MATIEPVTCLGCGCVCDDLRIRVEEGRIVEVRPACHLARAWFGDGVVPDRVLRGGVPASLDDALTEAAELLAAARGRVLVHLGLDLSAQAHRAALAVADDLRAVVDTSTSESAAAGLIAAQRRGRSGSTLGEIRNRADVVLFWGIDPALRYPRYLSRYALDPVGTHVPAGRHGRTTISVHVGGDRSPAGATFELTLDPDDEVTALSILRAVASGNTVGELPTRLRPIPELAAALLKARYAALIHDADPGTSSRAPERGEGLLALAQALNGPTRACLSSLRGGGNRSGAESVLSWQTGYPMAVEFTRGFPQYAPSFRGIDRLIGGAIEAALLTGSVAELTAEAISALARVPSVVIGPHASAAPFQPRVVIDTGIAGIHEGGTAYRLDEVPLPLRPPLPGQRSTAEVLRALGAAIRARPGAQR